VRPLILAGYGTVISRQGPEFGPASAITYTVRYTTSNGDLPDAAGQVPTTRWTASWVKAHPVNFSFPVAVVGESMIVAHFPAEMPEYVTECQS
jgi:hypothetical protein